MDRVVVTGGLGFIGSFVTDALLAAGVRVDVVDSQVGSVVDADEWPGEAGLTVHRVSVEEYLADGGSFDGADLVVHCASHVGPARILRDAGRLGRDIVDVSELVMRRAIEADAPLVLFSSAEVYGASGRLAEGDDLVIPRGYNARIEYAVAKALTEVMAANLAHRGLRAIAVRPFNVAGPRQSRDGGFVMPTFVQQALAGRPLTVFDTGRQQRAFLGASDLGRFVVDHALDAIAAGHGVVNLGNPDNESTVMGLAERVVALLDSDSDITRVDAKQVHGEQYEEAVSFRKLPVLSAGPQVGWEPKVDLDELIRSTAEYYARREDVRGGDRPW